jgi:hypothetical protein
MNQIVSVQDKPLTVAEVKGQVQAIQQIMKAVMQEGVHFGTIPGTKTPSLYKPGAEKIMTTFRLAADPEITDLSDDDQIRYQVRVKLISPSGIFLGAGIGECSSNEEKYKWRAALCQEEFEGADASRKREKWVKGKFDERARSYGAPYQIIQIRTEPADIANTVLKMAKKRGLIDAVLTATAASDIFTQDLEDLPAEYIDGVEQPRQSKPVKAPAAKNHTAKNSGVATEGQVKLLHGKLKSAGKSVEDYCSQMGVESIEATPFAKVNDAIAWITQ